MRETHQPGSAIEGEYLVPRSITDEEIDSMIEQDLREAEDQRAEINALTNAIDHLSDPLLRRIPHKIVELAL